ncbi:MAG TPA: chloride channel protein [Stellaceae bacterium]|nr:chloride channel protein [Stellaceae bacterium]
MPQEAGHWLGRRLQDLVRRTGQWGLRDSELGVLAVSAVLGIAIGAAVIGVQWVVRLVHTVFFDIGIDRHLSEGRGIDWWRLLLVPVLGGILSGIVSDLLRRSREREVVDAIEANALFGGKMSLVDSASLTFLTVISSGFGASVGMEAGFTQLGSGLASRAGQELRMRRGDLRTLVGCGAAAAIAAAFDAPLAGAFYAFELVIGSYTTAVLAPIAIAALSATLVVREVFQAESIFTLDRTVQVAGLDYVLFAVLGLAAAGIAVATMTGVTWVERIFRRLKVKAWARPVVGGLIVGLIAVVFPQVLGSGHGAIQLTLDRAIPAGVLLGLVAAKGLASAISVGSGFRGGLFSSSLLLGSVYGGVAVVLLQIAISALGYPETKLDPSAYMLVGTASVAAAVVGAPVTMIFLVLELTGSLPAALGVMVGVIIASVTVRLTFGYSFATWRFHVRGVAIRGGHDVGWVRDLTAASLMRRDTHVVPLGMTIADFRAKFPLGGHKRAFVVDAEGHYRGIVLAADAHNPDLGDKLDERTIDGLRFAEDNFLLPQQNIRAALGRFSSAESETLAVLSDPTERRLLGFVTEAYVLRRYNQELERTQAEEHGERTLFGPS